MKKDPNQLLLELEDARAELSRAVTNYVEKAVAAAAVPEARQAVRNTVKTEATRLSDARRDVCRGIGLLHYRTGIGFQQLFSRAYAELRNRTGFDPMPDTIVQGTRRRHIDTVEECGRMPDLLAVVGSMLRSPERFFVLDPSDNPATTAV